MSVHGSEIENIQTVAGALLYATESLKLNRVPEAKLSAEVLLSHVLKADRLYLVAHDERKLSPQEQSRFLVLVQRRSRRFPIAHLTGKKEFFSLPFVVSSDVLIPRPETELLVERAFKLVQSSALKHFTVCDVGTGSGNIAITLKKLCPHLEVTAIDVSRQALEVAEGNAGHHGVSIKFVHGDLFENVDGRFDLVLANLPYVPTGEIDELDDEVARFDPRVALDGGKNGLDVIERFCNNVGSYFADQNSRAVIEIGADQIDFIRFLAKRQGLTVRAVIRDLQGVARIVELSKG